MLPQFRRAGRDGVSVERRGKLALEMIPRNNTGAGFAWSDKTAIHLSVEEVGLLLSQLPGNEVELAHPVQVPKAADETAETAGERMEKVLTIVPGEGTTLTFKLDFVKDGVGGQAAPGSEGLSSIPLEMTVQAGEFEVLKSVWSTSIPYLLGWNTCMDVASASAMTRGLSEPNPTRY